MSLLVGTFLNQDSLITANDAQKIISRMIGASDSSSHTKFKYWFDSNVALALSSENCNNGADDKPYLSNSSRGTTQVFIHGKIHNLHQLKEQLQSLGIIFTEKIDQEVIRHGYKQWGTCLFAKLTGQFSIAIWDSLAKKMIIARDRFGEKPLYYFEGSKGFIFASDIKAILAYPGMPKNPDKVSIHNYLTFGFIVGPHTAFLGIKRLQPAHFMILESGKTPVIMRYWHLPIITSQSLRPNFDDLKHELVERLKSSIQSCLTTDKSVGILLSGEINSCALVAMAKFDKDFQVKTFSGCSTIGGDDESKFIEMVSSRYQTIHQNYTFGDEIIEKFAKLVLHYGEPFSNPSALLEFCFSNKIKEHASIVVTSEGADEILLGYHRYSQFKYLLEQGSHGRELEEIYLGQGRASASVKKVADTYGYIVELFNELQKVSFYGVEMLTKLQRCSYDSFIPYVEETATAEEMASRLDIAINLPDNLLVMSNVINTAAGLEKRSPFLNHEFAEFVLNIPAPQRLLEGYQKGLFRSALEPYLPKEVIYHDDERSRIPIAKNLLHKSFSRVKALLLSDQFLSRGVITKEAVETMLSEFFSNARDHSSRLWALVGLEVWYRTWIDSDTGEELVNKDNPFTQFVDVNENPGKVGECN